MGCSVHVLCVIQVRFPVMCAACVTLLLEVLSGRVIEMTFSATTCDWQQPVTEQV